MGLGSGVNISPSLPRLEQSSGRFTIRPPATNVHPRKLNINFDLDMDDVQHRKITKNAPQLSREDIPSKHFI